MVLTEGVTHGPLIDVAALASALSHPDPPVLLDVRWRLGGPSGRGDYAEGHLPGAVFVDLDTELCGPPGPHGRHPLPEPDVLRAVLRAAGVRSGHPVVVYDDGGGLAAARTWWTLRWAGHAPVAVLDGGCPAWVAAGHPVTTTAEPPEPGNIEVRPGGLPMLDAEAVTALIAAGGVLLDVRAAPRYRGEAEPIDPVAGHIPGATNLPFSTIEDVRSRFAGLGVPAGVPVGAYCGSGVTAAQAVLALHLDGRSDAALYVGSWSDWITDPSRPVATS